MPQMFLIGLLQSDDSCNTNHNNIIPIINFATALRLTTFAMSLLVRFFASPRRGISASGEKIGLVVGLRYFRTSFVDLLVLSYKLHKDDQDHSAGLANNSLHSGSPQARCSISHQSYNTLRINHSLINIILNI